MTFSALVWGPLAAFLMLVSPALWADDGIAWILGEEILRADLPASVAEPAAIGRFRDLVWDRVVSHYVAERQITVTRAEIAELLAYDREFERRDRAQRARKLAELDQRLAIAGLGGDERAWLEEFRAVLVRLARNDAENERLPLPDPDGDAAVYGPWVQWWKTNKALHEQYGGTVALTKAGPVAYGARPALLADYERRGLVRFLDPRLREQLFQLLAQLPAVVVPPDRVDFTPYWKQPIPPSYFPD